MESIIYVCLLDGLASSTSPEHTINFLEDFVRFLGQKIKEERYPSIEALWDAHERGETFLARLEGNTRRAKKESGVFLYSYRGSLLKLAEEYSKLFEDLPRGIYQIVETYNNDPSKPYRPIGSPMHIVVQGLRDAWGRKVIIGESGGIKIIRLGYKITKWVSPAKILGFDKIITEEGKKFFKDTRELELYLKDADLCYAIVPRETGKLD
ncbi:MAG: hypothetical protein APU95_05630 [Hadesarchaea archaeon YNP_N21]|nr:MAG: hypothetical protein APU95_05630 [Hadesarchaea archaeon YNP_N21]